MPMTRTLGGADNFIERIERATGRAIVAIGMSISADGKRITHRISGTLARSIHAAPAGELHNEDEEERYAATADLMLANGIPIPRATPLGPALEVGSWLPYACVEWVGRQHPGITQAVEMNRGARADAFVRQAFAEEGLV